MQSFNSRWLVPALLIGWTLSHATVLAQATSDKAPSAVEALRANLDKAVTLDYVGESLRDVIGHFHDKTDIKILMDPTAAQLDPTPASSPPTAQRRNRFQSRPPMKKQARSCANSSTGSHFVTSFSTTAFL